MYKIQSVEQCLMIHSLQALLSFFKFSGRFALRNMPAPKGECSSVICPSLFRSLATVNATNDHCVGPQLQVLEQVCNVAPFLLLNLN
jgi:hypothetical protein